MKTNTKKQTYDEILSLYCKIVSSLECENSSYSLEDVKKELEKIIQKG